MDTSVEHHRAARDFRIGWLIRAILDVIQKPRKHVSVAKNGLTETRELQVREIHEERQHAHAE